MSASNAAAPKKHIAIIGAGIVGVSAAVWLQRAGHAVTLIDRAGPAEGTSFGNGGVLASCAVVPVAVPGLWAKAPEMLFHPEQPLFLKWRYLPKLLPWLARYLRHANAEDARRTAAALFPIIGDSLADHQALADGTKAARHIAPSDYLYVYRSRRGFEADAFGWSLRAAHGFQWELLEGEAWRAYDPIFARDLGFAVRMGGHGAITDPGQYVKDLAAHVVEKGGRLLRAEATDFARADGVVTGVRLKTGEGAETLACDAAILATGVWSGPLAKKLGLSIPLESERGYHLELWAPNLMPRAPVMITSGKFVATPMAGRLRLAGIVEFGGLDAPPSRAPFALLERQIRAAIPDLTWSDKTEWMGHRPAPVDSIPIIGEVPAVKGAYLGFGHHHVGLTGGPKTGRILAQMISGQTPNLDLSPYAPARYGA